VLQIRPRTFLVRTLSAPAAGAAALAVAALLLHTLAPFRPTPGGGRTLVRWLPLVVRLAVCCLAYAAGYLAVPVGRGDLAALTGKLRGRAAG
jgi:hypothetical protein